jgi:proline dehydrogenase
VHGRSAAAHSGYGDGRSLIRDKIGNTEWENRLGASHSTFVNAGTWALMLTGRIVNLDNDDRTSAAP